MQKDAYIERLDAEYGTWFKNPEESSFPKGQMTKNLYPYNKMFEPIQINRLKIKNRLVMAPMGNINMCEETGRPNDKMLAYFAKRAKGGVGLITTGLVPVSHGIDPSVTEQGNLSYFPRIDNSRTNLSGWRDLAQQVHVYGARIFIQLTAGLGRVGNPECLLTQKKLPVSASWNKNYYLNEVPCKRLSGHKLKKIIKNMGQAAADAKECGMDGVYLHGHEGYLLDQMTNPAFNHRKMGRYADWQRFGLDTVKEIRARVGNDYPIMYRIELSAALNETFGTDMSDKSLNSFVNGRQINDTLLYMENLVKAGVDVFDVDLGCYENWWLPHPAAQMPAGCFLGLSRIVKKYFEERNLLSNAGLPIPVVGVGKLGYPDVAEGALRDAMCDMIMLGRPLLADPEWPNKAFNGQVEDICPCVGCQEGCIHEFVEGGHPQCAVNSETGFEDELPEQPQKADKQKKIAIIGAGPAGCACALEATKRGHLVDLYDQKDQVGGKLIYASIGAEMFDIENYRAYLNRKISENPSISLKLGKKITANDMKDQGYDVIVTAIGCGEGRMMLPGMERLRTATAIEVLTKPELVDGVNKIAIIGGQDGCEIAYKLAMEKGKDVSVLEPTPFFLSYINTANRGYLLHYLKTVGVKLYNCANPISVENGQLVFSQNKDKAVPNPYIAWKPLLPHNVQNPFEKKIKENFVEERIDTEMIIFAVPDFSFNKDRLYEDLVRRQLAPEIYNIGDSFEMGRILDANRAGSRLGKQI